MARFVQQDQKFIKDCWLTDELLQRTVHTPDWLVRKRESNIPVFVYGTLMSSGVQHWALEDSPFLGQARTAMCKYVMETAQYDDFPVLYDAKTVNSNTHRAIGECYLVDPMTLLRLDSIEENTVMFRREQHFITLLDQETPFRTESGRIRRPQIRAWIYFGIYDFWDKQETKPMKAVPFFNEDVFQFDNERVWPDDEAKMWDAYARQQLKDEEDEFERFGIPEFIRNPMPF